MTKVNQKLFLGPRPRGHRPRDPVGFERLQIGGGGEARRGSRILYAAQERLELEFDEIY